MYGFLILTILIQLACANVQTLDELFGSGHFTKADVKTKHLASSTEDLMLLFLAEKDVIQALLSNYSVFNQDMRKMTDTYLQAIDYK